MNEVLKMCEICRYAYEAIPENFPLAGVNRCMRCLKGNVKHRKMEKADITCDICGRSKPYTKFSAKANEALKGKNICYYCARRAGFNKPHIKIQCKTCGLIKPARDFPKALQSFGNYCKICVRTGKYTADAVKHIKLTKTPDIALTSE